MDTKASMSQTRKLHPSRVYIKAHLMKAALNDSLFQSITTILATVVITSSGARVNQLNNNLSEILKYLKYLNLKRFL
jgi:hypothetical protein